jgi:hypothetical protein
MELKPAKKPTAYGNPIPQNLNFLDQKSKNLKGCSISPPGGMRGWVRGYGGVGLWDA